MRTLIISGIVTIFILIQFFRGGEAARTIDGDGSGYYAYLTAVFIHGTTDFSEVFAFEKSRRSLDYMGHYFHQEDGHIFNKYYLGTALLMLPFFLLAMLYSFIIGMPVDGYNFLFQYAISLGAAVYAASGLIAGRKLLELFGISKKPALLTMVVILLGTNLFYYTFLHPSHSHVYSFAAVAWFLLYSRKFLESGSIRYFRIAMLLFGLVMLIRPTNGLVILIWPFLAGSFKVLMQRLGFLIKHPLTFFSGLLLFFLLFGLQPLYNYIQTGNFILYSYRNEGFVFNNPALLSFLFSYRKGFFVYTPLMLLIVPGLVLIYQRSKYSFGTFAGFLVLLFFVLSSWWNWFFGDSFGMRSLVDYYSLFAIPIGYIFVQIINRLKRILFVALLFMPFVFLNLFQTYQYYAGIIHPDSMTKDKYWYVFLKSDKTYRNVLGSFPEPVYSGMDETPMFHYFNDMEGPSNLWTSNGVQPSQAAFSGRYLSEMSQSNIYSPTLILEGEQLIHTPKELYVHVNLMFRELEPNAALDALMVYAATDVDNQMIFYKTFRLKQMPDSRMHQWRNSTFGFKVPAWNGNLKQVKIYVWNLKKGLFQLDDFEVTLHNLK
jgi:hypothetical protein